MTAKKQNRWRRLLRKAANVLKNNGWNRATKAKTAQGVNVDPLSENAASFCLIGALIKANGSLPEAYYGQGCERATDCESNKVYYEAIQHLSNHQGIRRFKNHGTFGIWEFNDKGGNTKETVINTLLEVANG